MKLHKYFLFSFFALSSGLISAQGVGDVVRLASYSGGTTARNLSTGNGLSPFGSDLSVMHSVNPAGLAGFRQNDLSFSLGFESVNNESEFGVESLSVDQTHASLESIGFVYGNSDISYEESGRFVFGISYSKLHSFNNRFGYNGFSSSSITDRFLYFADGVHPDDFYELEEGLAYNTGAIFDEDPDNNIYTSDLAPGDRVFQEDIVTETGSMSEFSLAAAAMFNKKTQVGVALGIPFFNSTRNSTYMESDLEDANAAFEDLEYRSFINQRGVGVNLKMGVNHRITNWTSIGLGIQTPSYFVLNETFGAGMTYQFFDGSNRLEEDEAIPLESRYGVNSAWRLDLSGGHIFPKFGFITLGLEAVLYDLSSFDFNINNEENFDDSNEIELDNRIKDELKSTLNPKVGFEVLLNKFRFRGGIKFVANPYEDINETNIVYNAGLGFSADKFYIDLGGNFFTEKIGYSPYTIPGENASFPFVNLNKSNTKITLTTGIRF